MIEILSLRKTYGEKVAVDSISFNVKKGEILGFLGPNGAGKTTTMRMLTGFIPPTSGTARVAGYDILEDPIEAKKKIGYLPETPPLYREMVVKSYLHFVSEIRGMEKGARKKRIDAIIDICGLGDVAGRIIGHLSKGYRQRVGLAQALLHEPEVIILDEPTSGLDPKQIIEIRNLIKSLGGDRTVILSTHILPEVSMVCQKVIIINEGKLVAEDSIEGLTRSLQGCDSVIATIHREDRMFTEVIRKYPGVLRVHPEGHKVFRIDMEKDSHLADQIAERIIGEGFGLRELKRVPPNLEEVFLKLITEEKEVEA
ncbi:MAG: ATP-binding cassette domain-containing protein [Acidobacteriota bacterium]